MFTNKIRKFGVKGFILASFASGLLLISCEEKSAPQMPLLSLPVMEVTTEDVPIFTTFVGQTYGFKDISIRARVDGVLEGMYFKEGTFVKKGTLLYTIDRQPLLAREAASMSQLAQAQTMLAKAESDLNRIRPLAANNAVSQRDLDAAVAQFEAAKSSVDAAQAYLNASRIELGYSRISAPISGIIGMSIPKPGDYVGQMPNPVILNTISQIDTIVVRFFLSENEYLNLSQRALSEEYEKKFVEEGIKLSLSNDEIFGQQGKLDFIDRSIDPNTGTIMLQASFPNPNWILRPGQFARIKLLYDFVPNSILIPKRAVKEMQTMHQVYVLGENSIPEIRMIEASQVIDQSLVVKSGLEPGEIIIVEGFEKLIPGMPIMPEPYQNKEVNNK
ncbi:MAG: efflux RND transporter periplasmic adaptor subunit [Bacteroidales bacterium]|nr:efflux RND transporter periplasmic adaptor subunit [Bacteroidales bacterium]